MAAPKMSEQEFIRIWRECGSSYKMAKVTGMAAQNIQKRKKTIEKKHGILLRTIDSLRRPRYDESMLVTSDRVEVKLSISDGCILVAGDQHFWPNTEVPVMHRALIHLLKKIKPFAVVWNGDAFDGSSISRFADIGWEKKPTVKEELETVKDRSDEVIKASANSKRIFCAGNHDLRFESRLASVAPEYKGVEGIHLKDHIPGWTPAWFVTVNEGTEGHTEIRHREGGSIHASYLNTLKSGVSIVTGHDHVCDVRPFTDRRGTRYGVRHGMTADSARDPQFVNYLEGRRPNWQSGLAVLTYKGGILLPPEIAMRFDEDSFVFRGQVIKV